MTNAAVCRRCRWEKTSVCWFALAQRVLADGAALAAVLVGCLSPWSASQRESTDPTCSDRCADSSGFLCDNIWTLTSFFPPSLPSVTIFCSCFHPYGRYPPLSSHSWLQANTNADLVSPGVLQVLLFEYMVETESSVQLYSQYMEVKTVLKSAREQYTRLTDGVFLNEVMRIM